MKITDQSLLTLGQEVVIDTSAKTIQLVEVGNMTSDGVSLQCLYSFISKLWNTNADLIKYWIPMNSYGEQYELVNGWTFLNQATIDLVKDFGFAVKDAAGNSLEEFMNITTLGLFDDDAVDNAYYLQDPFGVPVNIPTTGPVNQAIKIYGDADNGNIDYRSYFQIFVREQGKTYASVDLITSQNIAALTFKSYAVALANKPDTNVIVDDVTIETTEPYTGMSITYGVFQRNINGVAKDFGVIIDGNNGTLEQIYEYVQYQLRSADNINADNLGLPVRGDVAEDLLTFVADTLMTNVTMFGGVYIDNFRSIDINNIIFTDNYNTELSHPLIAAGILKFNDIIQSDADAIYRMFFANDQAADVPAGKDFGTELALLVNDKNDLPIAGAVGGAAEISFEYDYTYNEQRGVGSANKPVPVVVVVQGLTETQHTVVEGIIEDNIYNIFSLVGSKERNYLA